MTTKFKTVALIGRHDTEKTQLLEDIQKVLEAEGCFIGGWFADAPGPDCDLAVVVGGDGTMLGVARKLAQYGTPLIGINGGRLGFITDISPTNFEEPLREILRGEYKEDRRHLIRSTVVRDGKVIFNATALNDVVINRGSITGMVEVTIEIDGRYVANHRADGLILATATGSTAYALSVGGPILHPDNPSWVLAPIAPQGLTNRPIVIPDFSTVTIIFTGGADASANFDMQGLASLKHGDRIISMKDSDYARFLHPLNWSYYDTLRNKLHWNE